MKHPTYSLAAPHHISKTADLWQKIDTKQREINNRLGVGLLKFGLQKAGTNRLAQQHVLQDALNRVGFECTTEALVTLGLSRSDFAAA